MPLGVRETLLSVLTLLFDKFIGITGVTPKAGADSVAGADKADKRNVTGAAETKAETAETAPLTRDGNTLFAAVTNLNVHLTALHAALPPRTALSSSQDTATRA